MTKTQAKIFKHILKHYIHGTGHKISRKSRNHIDKLIYKQYMNCYRERIPLYVGNHNIVLGYYCIDHYSVTLKGYWLYKILNKRKMKS